MTTATATVKKRKKHKHPKSTGPDAALSPKVTRPALATIVAGVGWTVIAKLAPDTFTPDTLAMLIGSTSTLVVSVTGYKVLDPLRAERGSVD